MKNGEILNAGQTDSPLFEVFLYGDRVLTEKFSKRLSCALKHLPLRLKLHYVHDTDKAVEAGIAADPTLVLNGKIFLEGLVQAEEITAAFKSLLADKEAIR